jgi:hypothetical protein
VYELLLYHCAFSFTRIVSWFYDHIKTLGEGLAAKAEGFTGNSFKAIACDGGSIFFCDGYTDTQGVLVSLLSVDDYPFADMSFMFMSDALKLPVFAETCGFWEGVGVFCSIRTHSLDALSWSR